MDGNLSHWLATAPPWHAPDIALPDQADLVILGAGIMGAATAYWLARLGQPALVLERNPHPSAGATGRNAGMHVPGPADNYADTIERLGRPAAKEIWQATVTNGYLLERVLNTEGIDADYTMRGMLALAADGPETAQAQLSTAHLREDGFAVEWLTPHAAGMLWGVPVPASFGGAMLSKRAATLHSARYTMGVAAAAAKRGAQFAYNTTVTGVTAAGEGWRVTTSRGEVVARRVVVALNAWAGDLFPDLRSFIVPVRGHILVTAPVRFQLRPWMANLGFEYGRQLPDGRLLIGGMRRTRPDRDEGYPPAAGENAPPVEPSVVAALEQALPALIPGTLGVPTERAWSGVMDFTPDHAPLVGAWPGQPGLWLLVGLSGHGMCFSQVLPYGLAAQITGRDGPTVPAPYAPGRFLR